MRIYSAALFLLILSVVSNVMAVEPVMEQQIMVYYQIPFGGSDQHANKHKFGLRLDRTSHGPYETVQLGNLMKKPAMFDFQMRHAEDYTFKIHGVDYTKKLLAQRADAEEGDEVSAETATDIEADMEAEAEAGAETAVADEEVSDEAPEETEKEKTDIQKAIGGAPVGVFIGVILLGVLLVGAG